MHELRLDREQQVAIFVDVENVGLTGKQQTSLGMVVRRVLEMIQAQLGPAHISILNAYLDLHGSSHESISKEVLALGGTPVQIIGKGGDAKRNAADLQICIDATEIMCTKNHIGVFVLVSGDGDFFPLAKKLRENGRVVIGAGRMKSTHEKFKALCHQFVEIVPNVENSGPTIPDPLPANCSKLVRRLAPQLPKSDQVDPTQALQVGKKALAVLLADPKGRECLSAGSFQETYLRDAIGYALLPYVATLDRTTYVTFLARVVDEAGFLLEQGILRPRPAIAAKPPQTATRSTPEPSAFVNFDQVRQDAMMRFASAPSAEPAAMLARVAEVITWMVEREDTKAALAAGGITLSIIGALLRQVIPGFTPQATGSATLKKCLVKACVGIPVELVEELPYKASLQLMALRPWEVATVQASRPSMKPVQ